MRHLWAGGRPRREADPDVVVAKDLGSAAALGRLQPASGSERYGRWRAIHPRSPLAGARPVFLSFLVLDSVWSTKSAITQPHRIFPVAVSAARRTYNLKAIADPVGSP